DEANRLMIRYSVLRSVPFRDLRTAPERRRRMAEIALEEGELLGLRLPGRARILLGLAHDLFLQSDDAVGMTIAAIRGLIAGVHAGEQGVEAILTRSVRPAYENLAAGYDPPELPAWPDLVKCVAEEPDRRDRLDHPLWGPWLHRLFRCLVWM